MKTAASYTDRGELVAVRSVTSSASYPTRDASSSVPATHWSVLTPARKSVRAPAKRSTSSSCER